MPSKHDAAQNRLTQSVAMDADDEDEVLPGREAPSATRPASPPPRRRQQSADAEQGTLTVYVSEGVSRRLDEYRRKKSGRTNRDVILEAIEANHANLAKIIEQSKVSTAPTSSLFPEDPRSVRYLGGGKAQTQFTPTPAQKEVLLKLGKELGFSKTSTWIAPILNHFLPGRKELAARPGSSPDSSTAVGE